MTFFLSTFSSHSIIPGLLPVSFQMMYFLNLFLAIVLQPRFLCVRSKSVYQSNLKQPIQKTKSVAACYTFVILFTLWDVTCLSSSTKSFSTTGELFSKSVLVHPVNFAVLCWSWTSAKLFSVSVDTSSVFADVFPLLSVYALCWM